MEFDWKNIVGTVAPTIATALGGPLAGLAVKSLGSALGIEQPTEATVTAALRGATPDDLLKVQQADQQFQSQMASLGVDLERIAAADRTSARSMQSETKSRIPGILAGIVTVGFFAILVGLMSGKLETSNNPELLILLGALSTSWGAVVSFYFGSSASSQNKDKLLAAGK
jgi:hypothetical protein